MHVFRDKWHARAPLFFYFENARSATTMVGLSIGATIFGLSYMLVGRQLCLDFFYVPVGHQPCLDFFYVLVGHQPCMDFFMCQQDINHVWNFL